MFPQLWQAVAGMVSLGGRKRAGVMHAIKNEKNEKKEET